MTSLYPAGGGAEEAGTVQEVDFKRGHYPGFLLSEAGEKEVRRVTSRRGRTPRGSQ